MARTYRGWRPKRAKRCRRTGKTSFRSTDAARRFVATRDIWHGDYTRVYRCEHCDWYHLTSQPTRFDRPESA